jgi:osmotically-inducible protein OsmY
MSKALRKAAWQGSVALAAAMSVLPARAGASDDATIRQRIESRLERAGLDERADVRVEVANGRALLTGAVTTAGDLAAAQKAALKETKSVENRLRVLPEERSDALIGAAARKSILGYVRYSVFDSVGLQVSDGVVTLTGSVLTPDRKRDIEERVARLAGVREVRNQVQVQSFSSFDEALRLQIYRAIYGSDRFVNLSRANPPVRIVVDRGRVTLTGTVGTSVERAQIANIARSTLAFSVDDRIEVESEREKEPRRTTAVS